MSPKQWPFDIQTAQRLVRVALGHEEADLVLRDATYLNVFTETWERGDIAIADGRIAGTGKYQGKTEISAEGQYVVPGFIDGHIHLESSLVSPAEFARAVVPYGTTAVIADPHEIANVLGLDGIEYIKQASAGLPLDVWLMLPSCVPATEEDESGAILSHEDILPLYDDPRVLGLAEMMNFPGVLRGDESVLQKIKTAHDCGAQIDGHAPGLSGKGLNAYIVCGITSDHECSTLEEAKEKISKGQWVLMREGTAAHNLRALIPLLSTPCASRCLFATDDKHPEDLCSSGHMQSIISQAVQFGADPIVTLKAASYNAACAFSLTGYGAIAPGYTADIVILKDLKNFQVLTTIKNGKTVFDKRLMSITEPTVDPALAEKACHTFHMPELSAESFALETPAGVIKLVPGQIISENGGLTEGVDPSRDIVKIAVAERHQNTGHIGIGYLQGYGLKRGAVATSIAHDSHNLIVAGVNDEDMACAANRVRELGGGIVLVVDGKICGELALPIAGLMSPDSLMNVNTTLERLKQTARFLGTTKYIDPFMTLSFMSLPVIPSLRILTRGVFDVDTWSYVVQPDNAPAHE